MNSAVKSQQDPVVVRRHYSLTLSAAAVTMTTRWAKVVVPPPDLAQ